MVVPGWELATTMNSVVHGWILSIRRGRGTERSCRRPANLRWSKDFTLTLLSVPSESPI